MTMRKHLTLPGAAAGIALAVAAIQTNAAAAESSQRDRLLAAFDRILGNYVDELDESELVTAAINGMTGVLDSQSVYITNKDFRNMMVSARGFVGLGLEIAIDKKGSVRNRHCPKCQAAASRGWLADREAELLPVPYFHVVYTLPSRLRDIAYQNKRAVYDLLSARSLPQLALEPPCRPRRSTTARHPPCRAPPASDRESRV